MKARKHVWSVLLCLGILVVCGCRRNIVRAAPAAVDSPPQPSASAPAPQPQPSTPVATVEPQPEPQPEPEPPPAPVASASKPAPPPRPRTAPVDAGAIRPTPEPEPPQISPALTPQQQSTAMRLTTNDVRTAEKNLQVASGKKLNASQNDLAEKVRGFLAQAHEAIRANDWVRAQSLAHKAHILSIDLAKSL